MPVYTRSTHLGQQGLTIKNKDKLIVEGLNERFVVSFLVKENYWVQEMNRKKKWISENELSCLAVRSTIFCDEKQK